jgi:hypothetical protein
MIDTMHFQLFLATFAGWVGRRVFSGPSFRHAQVLGSIPSASSKQIKGLRIRSLPSKRPILHLSYTLNLAEMTVSADKPNGGDLHVRIRRGPRLGNWAGLLYHFRFGWDAGFGEWGSRIWRVPSHVSACDSKFATDSENLPS